MNAADSAEPGETAQIVFAGTRMFGTLAGTRLPGIPPEE